MLMRSNPFLDVGVKKRLSEVLRSRWQGRRLLGATLEILSTDVAFSTFRHLLICSKAAKIITQS